MFTRLANGARIWLCRSRVSKYASTEVSGLELSPTSATIAEPRGMVIHAARPSESSAVLKTRTVGLRGEYGLRSICMPAPSRRELDSSKRHLSLGLRDGGGPARCCAVKHRCEHVFYWAARERGL